MEEITSDAKFATFSSSGQVPDVPAVKPPYAPNRGILNRTTVMIFGSLG